MRSKAICALTVIVKISALASVAMATTRRYSYSSNNSGNDIFWWFIGIMVALLVLAVVSGIFSIGKKMSSTEREFAEDAYKLCSKGMDAKTSRKAEEALLQYETAHTLAESRTSLISEHIYQDDLADLRMHYETLVEEEWQARADKLLDKFRELYLLITNSSFSDVEIAYKSKRRCIQYWQKYFASLPEGVYVYPKRYMRDYLGEDYDPCMESHDALERKLSAIIDAMRPEYKRKNMLYGIIVNYVAARGSIARADLLRTKFDGFVAEEVKCCYRALIKANRLVEVKLGGKFFVSLSDKEATKAHTKDAREEREMIASSDKLVHDAIVKHLMDEGEDYIDMTHKGGCLYFFSERIAEELKAKGYSIGYAVSGSRSTSGRSAWYLKQ